MASFVTRAIVLRHVNYRDNDRMLTLFSPEHGRVDAVARGCRKSTSKMLNASETFCAGEYMIYTAHGRSSVTQCQIHEMFYALRESYARLTAGARMLRLCETVVQPDAPAAGLFALLLRALAFLCEDALPEWETAMRFEAGLLTFEGLAPKLSRCLRCGSGAAPFGLDMVGGGAVCASCAPGALRLPKEGMALLRDAFETGLGDALLARGQTEEAREGLRDAAAWLSNYTDMHLEPRR